VDEEAGQGSVTASRIASRKFAEFTLAIRILNLFHCVLNLPLHYGILRRCPQGGDSSASEAA
jgi:hypothetical protein